jgi:predicted amidohydrolase YtcJ
VTRVTRRGNSLGSDDLRISAFAALRAHTYEGAASLGREDDLGSLEVGKYADFAVLADDPLAVEPERIAEIRVLQTWVGGVPKYTSDAAPMGREAMVGAAAPA